MGLEIMENASYIKWSIPKSPLNMVMFASILINTASCLRDYGLESSVGWILTGLLLYGLLVIGSAYRKAMNELDRYRATQCNRQIHNYNNSTERNLK